MHEEKRNLIDYYMNKQEPNKVIKIFYDHYDPDEFYINHLDEEIKHGLDILKLQLERTGVASKHPAVTTLQISEIITKRDKIFADLLTHSDPKIVATAQKTKNNMDEYCQGNTVYVEAKDNLGKTVTSYEEDLMAACRQMIAIKDLEGESEKDGAAKPAATNEYA